MINRLVNFIKRLFVPEHNLENPDVVITESIQMVLDDSGMVLELTSSAHQILGSHLVGRNLTDLLTEETQRQIIHELMTAGIAPEKFSIDEIAHHSLINGEDYQRWLMRAWPNVPVAVQARIVPRYEGNVLAGYLVHIN